jgi:hypothetical protein
MMGAVLSDTVATRCMINARAETDISSRALHVNVHFTLQLLHSTRTILPPTFYLLTPASCHFTTDIVRYWVRDFGYEKNFSPYKFSATNTRGQTVSPRRREALVPTCRSDILSKQE